MGYQATFRGRRIDLQRFLNRLPRILAGKSPDPTGGGVRAILIRVGLVALAIIRDAYVLKASGEADESGLKWAPLKPATIAYKRRHPGLKRDTLGAHRPSSMLTGQQRTTWWALYRRGKAKYKGDKSHAAAAAWVALKKIGGIQTILSVYGNVKVDILRDTDRLFNSLSPGIAGKDNYFSVEPGVVKVGTNVPYGGKQHRGDPSKNLPARPLWPPWEKWPDEWKRQIYDALYDGIADLITRWLAGGARE